MNEPRIPRVSQTLVEALRQAAANTTGPVLVATDGGSTGKHWHQAAGWGAAVERHGQPPVEHGGWVAGADQAFWALLRVLLAANVVQCDLVVSCNHR